MTKAEVTIKSQPDLALFRVGLITQENIRQIIVNAVIDEVGRFRLIINDKIRQRLGLSLVGERYLDLKDGTEMIVPVAEAVELRFQNRRTITQPLILEDVFEVVLGSFILTDLGVLVDREKGCLVVEPDSRNKRTYVKTIL